MARPTAGLSDEEHLEQSSLKRMTVRRAGEQERDAAWSDLGRFAEAIRLAQRELLAAAQTIRDEFGLGPRGTWILGLIATGRVATQADVVKRYKVGRSVITGEMAQLANAGLVSFQPHPKDGRQISLSLTREGEEANSRIGDAMAAKMAERLGRYTLGDLLFCTGLLEDLARPTPG